MIFRRLIISRLNFRPYSIKSRVRHRYHEECEEAVNKQINAELHASHAYMGLAWIFKHDSVSLPGFYKMFEFMSREEIDHAWAFLEYQVLRGGKVTFSAISEPRGICPGDLTPASAIDHALSLELSVTKMIEDLYSLASKHNDSHLEDFLTVHCIGEQYDALKYLGDLRTQIDLVNGGAGLYHLDLKLVEKYSKSLNKSNQ